MQQRLCVRKMCCAFIRVSVSVDGVISAPLCTRAFFVSRLVLVSSTFHIVLFGLEFPEVLLELVGFQEHKEPAVRFGLARGTIGSVAPPDLPRSALRLGCRRRSRGVQSRALCLSRAPGVLLFEGLHRGCPLRGFGCADCLALRRPKK